MLGDLIALASPMAESDGVFAAANPAITLRRRSLPMPARAHELAPQLAVVLQGAKRFRIDGQVRALRAGEYAVISARTPTVSAVTRAAPHVPYLGLLVALDPVVVAGVLDVDVRRDRVIDRVHVPTRSTAPLSPSLARAIADLLAGPPQASGILVERLVDQLVGAGHRDALRALARYVNVDPIVARAIAWFEAHLAEPLSIARLARAIGASTSAVHHRFKLATATTPLQFHKRLRLEHARRLMAASDLGVGATARAVGYASAAQFSRDYRRAFALPPSRDRALSRIADPAD